MDAIEKLAKVRKEAEGIPRDKFVYEWVQEVMKQSTREGRRAILNCVPEDIRSRVATKVEMEFEKIKRQK